MQPRATRGREGAGTRAPAAALLDLGADSARRSCARSPRGHATVRVRVTAFAVTVWRAVFFNITSTLVDRLCRSPVQRCARRASLSRARIGPGRPSLSLKARLRAMIKSRVLLLAALAAPAVADQRVVYVAPGASEATGDGSAARPYLHSVFLFSSDQFVGLLCCFGGW